MYKSSPARGTNSPTSSAEPQTLWRSLDQSSSHRSPHRQRWRRRELRLELLDLCHACLVYIDTGGDADCAVTLKTNLLQLLDTQHQMILKHLGALYLHNLMCSSTISMILPKLLSRQLIPAPVRSQRVYSSADLARSLTGSLIFARFTILASIEATNSRSIVSHACSKCLRRGLSFGRQYHQLLLLRRMVQWYSFWTSWR